MKRQPTDDAGKPQEDQIYLVTRIVAALLAPVLILSFVILYLRPDDTGEHFAWAISPRMTPMIMGAGYVAGAYYFIRMAIGRSWRRIGVPLPAVSIFATIMAILTVIHWDAFNHDHIAFSLWVVLYLGAPPLVFWLWYQNRRTDPGTRTPNEPVVPSWIRAVLLAAGVVSLMVTVWMFFLPDRAIDVWPWKLSPLTARIIAGWVALGGSAAIILARDERWGAWRTPFETTLIWAILVGIAIPRASGNFDWDAPGSWLFLGIVCAWAASFGAVIAFMEWHQRSHQSASRTAPATDS